MRVDDANRLPQAPAAAGADKTNAGQTRRFEGEAAPGSGTDNAEISSLTRALQAGDPQRLQKLQLDVQNGQYQVSADKVAKAIVEDATQP
jgi:anti-sigma28 factor (negative regulator of flagellin synthesis)